MQMLLPALAGAALLGLVLFLVIGPNKDDPKAPVANGKATAPSATQMAKDGSPDGMSKELPPTTEDGYEDIGGGLKIKDVVAGEGDAAPVGSTVNCHYAGWQVNGTMFDSTYLKGRPSLEFSLDQVIEGWKKGIPGMKPGTVRRLIIPANMAYGNGGGGPAGTLVFEVKLVSWR